MKTENTKRLELKKFFREVHDRKTPEYFYLKDIFLKKLESKQKLLDYYRPLGWSKQKIFYLEVNECFYGNKKNRNRSYLKLEKILYHNQHNIVDIVFTLYKETLVETYIKLNKL